MFYADSLKDFQHTVPVTILNRLYRVLPNHLATYSKLFITAISVNVMRLQIHE